MVINKSRFRPISLITGWTVYTEKYKVRGPVVYEGPRALSRGGGHFRSKVIGMLVVFSGYKILILVFFRVSGKVLENGSHLPQKQPSKLEFRYFLGV